MMRVNSLLIFIAISFAFAKSVQADDDAIEQQDFLFLLEEAYTQESGEWQFGAAYAGSFSPSANIVEFELEYGLTDRLQVAAEVPLIVSENVTEFGDAEFSVDYALLKDGPSLAPELTLGVAIAAPTGGGAFGVGGWAYAASLRISKQIKPGFYLHAVGAYEWAPNGGADADALSEYIAGVGGAWRVTDSTTVSAEFLHEREREVESGLEEIEREFDISVGLIREIASDLLIGVAGAFAVAGDSDNNELLAKLQYEW